MISILSIIRPSRISVLKLFYFSFPFLFCSRALVHIFLSLWKYSTSLWLLPVNSKTIFRQNGSTYNIFKHIHFLINVNLVSFNNTNWYQHFILRNFFAALWNIFACTDLCEIHAWYKMIDTTATNINSLIAS